MKLRDQPEFLAPALHDAVAEACGCKVAGVAIGDPNDRSTWRVTFVDGATVQQLQAAAAVIEAFDVEATVSK